MHELTEQDVTANYEAESAQKTLTAKELHAQLAEVIAEGNGDRPVFLMVTRTRAAELGRLADGLTHAVPIKQCWSCEDYDGEHVWIG